MSESRRHDFCNDYFLLNPREASILDLLRLLFSSDLEKRGFINSPPEKLCPCEFRHRWLIFVSVVIQKLFIFLKDPLAILGFSLVYWLNLTSVNGGFFMILPNFIKGKFVWPESSSEKFVSVCGNLDGRLDLDRRMESGTDRYIAMLSIMSSKLSYENNAFVKSVVENNWKMESLGCFECWNAFQKLRSTEAIMLRDTTAEPNLIVVAFRGTDPFDANDLCTDIDISWYELKGLGRIHGGFMKALGLQEKEGWPKEINPVQTGESSKRYAYYTIRQQLRKLLEEHKTAKIVLTGHSMGGALAVLFTGLLALHQEEGLLERLEGVYTFGQPRVGDEQFGEFMKGVLNKYRIKYERYVYCDDIVPRLPFDDKTLLFKHFGACLYYNSCYKGKVEEEEPNKNYFNVFWVIPKTLNAVWELIRSFILPYLKGPEYKEGWLLRCFRVIGLVMPGLIAHFPPNYVNITRLGSSITEGSRSS